MGCIKKFVQSNDRLPDVDTMVKEFERLVNGLAARYCCDGLDLEDLKQEAWIAILEKRPLYRVEMGVSLQTFLGRKIRHRLEKYRNRNLNLVEESREWVAESIADGPDAALKAETKEECELLRAVAGRDRFKKPRRCIETVRATVSLDEGWDSEPDGEGPSSMHERVGVPPLQELELLAAEASRKVSTKLGRKGGELADIFRLRSEGHTFEQIGALLGKELSAVHKAYSRAQKRLVKAKAA